MPLDRLRITNLEKWGNLVKTWATGVNKLGDNNVYPKQPLQGGPQSLQEFVNQCALAGVGVHVPTYVTEVQLVQAESKSILLLRIPTKELVEDSETTLQQPGTSYTIPDFYNRIFNRPAGPVNLPFADNMKVHAERIGDYTMSACQ